jgi:hypothetical protein
MSEDAERIQAERCGDTSAIGRVGGGERLKHPNDCGEELRIILFLRDLCACAATHLEFSHAETPFPATPWRLC